MKNQKLESHPPLPQILKSAVQAALASGKILRKYFLHPLKVQKKPGAGLVTNADFAAQDEAVKILKKAYPRFGFLTEEAPPEKASCPGRWIIDPLDGTTNFVHGFPMFCVSIAAEWAGTVIAGAIYQPILDELYTATQGQGAFLNGKHIQVSKTLQLRDSLLTTGFHCQKRKALKPQIQTFETLSQTVRAVRRPGSAALDLAYTARGVFDGFWERYLAPWDIAAGVLLVHEAGGKVTDFKNSTLSLQSQEILASNSYLHSALLRKINQPPY